MWRAVGAFAVVVMILALFGALPGASGLPFDPSLPVSASTPRP